MIISRGLAMITMTRYTGDVPKALPSMLSANAPQVTDRRCPFDWCCRVITRNHDRGPLCVTCLASECLHVEDLYWIFRENEKSTHILSATKGKTFSPHNIPITVSCYCPGLHTTPIFLHNIYILFNLFSSRVCII